METRIAATEEAKKELAKIAEKSVELIAALHILDMEVMAILEKDARAQGIFEAVTNYDFQTNEFITSIPNLDTEEGRAELARTLGVESVGFVLAKGEGQEESPNISQVGE